VSRKAPPTPTLPWIIEKSPNIKIEKWLHSGIMIGTVVVLTNHERCTPMLKTESASERYRGLDAWQG
jgi:hypothetical protein